MIISLEELKAIPKFANYDVDDLEREIGAIETAIRSYTNNKFHDTRKRIECASVGGALQGTSPYFKAGDTVEVSKSNNAGLYVIANTGETTALDGELYDEPYNLVTKVVYPADVVAGALRLLDWKFTKADKVGVQNESISRHSVSYFNMDGDNSIMGYPKSLFGFLKPYKKARF